MVENCVTQQAGEWAEKEKCLSIRIKHNSKLYDHLMTVMKKLLIKTKNGELKSKIDGARKALGKMNAVEKKRKKVRSYRRKQEITDIES